MSNHLRHNGYVTYLLRLGFVVTRPKKRLLKADETRRAAFARQYVALRQEVAARQANIFFVDEAHFYADVDLYSTWPRSSNVDLLDIA